MQKATTGDAWGVAVTLTLVVVSACGGSGTVTPAAGPGGTASATSGHEAPAATAGAPATPVHQAALPEAELPALVAYLRTLHAVR